MSYYRYFTGVYRSYWPELNRTLRSRSAPRHIPEPVPTRISRASSVPPSAFYSDSFFSRSTAATPFRDRSLSMPRQLTYSYDARYIVTPPTPTHYTDFDCKVLDYMGRLEREDSIRSSVTSNRIERYYDQSSSNSYSGYSSYNSYPSNSYSGYSSYNSSPSINYGVNYPYPSSLDVLGNWKHYNLSGETLNYRNMRAKSPLITRELNRYVGKKPNYIGDVSSGGACDFRHYNYRRVPYFGGSDDYQYIRHPGYRGGRSI